MERAEDHGEDDAEGVVEARDGPIHERRMLNQSGCDPRVRQLQKGCTAGAEKQSRLSIDAPN